MTTTNNNMTNAIVSAATADKLRAYALRYETASFLQGDPSWFMHQVHGRANQEAMAFLASCLSYGSRRQFMPKIQQLLDWSCGEVDAWVRSGEFARYLHEGSKQCYYRLYTEGHMHDLLRAYKTLLCRYGTLGDYVATNATDGYTAVAAICKFFASEGANVVVPKDTQSACTRVCMFMRWMVRSGSPVDLGLWADNIDRRTLIMPLDTHVVSQACRLNLLHSRTASMSVARRLTQALAQVFPDDPLRGDFALFGYGVNEGNDLPATE